MSALEELHGGSYKRAVFYFPKGDEAGVEEFITMPDHRISGEVRDIHFKFCGHKLKKSNEFDRFIEESVPSKFQGRFSKSEKGIDIEICCDALRLASMAKVDRLFLFTNDGDFIPLCRTIKEFGANISVLHLSDLIVPNIELLREADSYDTVPIVALDEMFMPSVVRPPTVPGQENGLDGALMEAAATSEKPSAAPSDLLSIDKQ
jgi:uncharacterized LabA/DUF88 family protein